MQCLRPPRLFRPARRDTRSDRPSRDDRPPRRPDVPMEGVVVNESISGNSGGQAGGRRESRGAGGVARRYTAVTRWDCDRWSTHVEDANGFRVDEIVAASLNDVEGMARRRLAEVVGGSTPDAIDLCIDVQLPPAIELALQNVRGLDATEITMIDQIVAALSGLGVSPADIAVALANRMPVTDARPWLVPNVEIAAHGLGNWPDAVAVHRSEYGTDPAIYCRACVDRNRILWTNHQEGVSVVLFAISVQCDRCRQEVPSTSPPRSSQPHRRRT